MGNEKLRCFIFHEESVPSDIDSMEFYDMRVVCGRFKDDKKDTIFLPKVLLTDEEKKSALSYTEFLEKPILLPLNDLGIPCSEILPMYTLSTQDMHFGAIALMYPNTLEAVAEVLGDFYLIPSSIHELILVKTDAPLTASELKNTLYGMNSLLGAEKLSDYIFVYSKKEKKLKMAA